MRELQRQIIKELGVQPIIDPKQEVADRSQLLTNYLAEHDKQGFVLGISGGQDSLLVGLLAQRAVEMRRANGARAAFHAILLPYGEQADRADALLAIDTIRPDHTYDFNIKPMTDAFAQSYADALHEPLADYHKGNAKARARMMAQYAVAGAHDLVVLGTDHAAEALAGFFTKFGDGAADVMPISNLNKRQGRQVLRFLEVPEIFTSKAPTADLLDNTPGQPDEKELGVRYDDMDDYLEGKQVDTHIADAIEQRYIATAHKRELPVVFGPEKL